MTIPRVCAALAVLGILTLVPSARANWLNGPLRTMGIGCSDGYHSRSNCPPRTIRLPKLPFSQHEVPAEEITVPAEAKPLEMSARPLPRNSCGIVPPSQAARPSPPPSSWR